MDRVVAEHGEEAAIAAVNRVRSGGVAGFFCREEFEVVVDPDGEVPGPEPEEDPDEHPDDETVGEALARRAAAVDDPAPARLGFRADQRARTDDDSAAVEDGEPAGDDPAEADVGDEAETGATATPVFGGPIPPGSEPGRDRFLTVLERRLEETATTEADLRLRRTRSADPDHEAAIGAEQPVAPAPAEAAAPAPAVGPGPALTPSPVPRRSAAVGSSVRSRARQSKPAFWRGLDRTAAELASFLPAGSPLTAVVGPLASATAVVHGLQSTTELASADVVVLTDRAGIVSEPSWELVRTGDRLVRRLGEAGGRPTIALIDVPVDLPPWVVPLQRRLRSVGVGLFRYAVSGQPAGDLERYRQGADVPYAIDLMSRVDPDVVVSLIADRHPIRSIAGVDLGPELLLALRRHVGVDAAEIEAMTDG